MVVPNYALAAECFNELNPTKDGTAMSGSSVEEAVKATMGASGKPEDLEFIEWLKNMDVFELYAKKVKESEKPAKTAKSTKEEEKVQKQSILEAPTKAPEFDYNPEELQSKTGCTVQEMPYVAADAFDEYLIEEHIQGAKPLAYEIITKSKNPQTGQYTDESISYILSVEGLTAASLIQGNIEVQNLKYEKIEGRLVAKAWVKDLKANVIQIGISENPGQGKTGETFKLTTLGSKAVRNALNKIISPKIKEKVLESALTAKAVMIIK